MSSLQDCVRQYKNQLAEGYLQKAYKGILEYLMALRTHFEKQFPEWTVPGGLYTGYMDMSYFSIIPTSLKERKLKIAVVFIHEACRFEVWLAGVNKAVQAEYWQLIKLSGWSLYKPVATTQGADAIIESVLLENPNFDDLPELTKQIQKGTQKFIFDIEAFLSDKG